MSYDIVPRLRSLIGNCKCLACKDRQEAADEIERLRANPFAGLTDQQRELLSEAIVDLYERISRNPDSADERVACELLGLLQ